MHVLAHRFLHRLTLAATLGVALLAGVFFSGCSDTVIDPFSNDGKYFTIYGFLDVLETNHAVRVIPVTRRAERILDPSDAQADIDARVFTTDMLSGDRREWTHHLEKLDDGAYGHMFRSSFIVRPTRTYRIEVVRSDGVTASAETRIPYISEANIFELGPEEFSADSTVVGRDIFIPRIPSPWKIQTIYIWSDGVDINRRVYVEHGRTGFRRDNGWHMRMNISEDQQFVRDNIQWSIDTNDIPASSLVGISAMGVQLRMLDSEWDPPGGIFDPEILAVPGTFSNVTNGYGRFGSVGLYIQEWNAVHLSRILGYDF